MKLILLGEENKTIEKKASIISQKDINRFFENRYDSAFITFDESTLLVGINKNTIKHLNKAKISVVDYIILHEKGEDVFNELKKLHEWLIKKQPFEVAITMGSPETIKYMYDNLPEKFNNIMLASAKPLSEMEIDRLYRIKFLEKKAGLWFKILKEKKNGNNKT